MAGAWKDSFPPLLPLGWHPMDLASVRRLCVTRFPDSIIRASIMDGLEYVVGRLNQSGLHMEVWIDGSFVTEKLNPEDSDIAVQFSGAEYDAALPAQKAPVQWATATNLVPTYKCDCYPFPVFPAGHPLHAHGEWRRSYWLAKFGHDRLDNPKGLAVIKLPFVIR
jgi:hypothetical protein